MGYRSEVAITMYTKDYNKMINRAQQLKDNSIYQTITSAEKWNTTDKKVTILKFKSIKWYSEYKDIQWIEHFIQKINSYFIRIGEEYQDIETYQYGDDYDLQNYSWISREIALEDVINFERKI